MSCAIRVASIGLVLGLTLPGAPLPCAADDSPVLSIQETPKPGAAKPAVKADRRPAAEAVKQQAAAEPMKEKTAADRTPVPAAPRRPAPRRVLSAEMAGLRDEVRKTLASLRQQQFNTQENTVSEIVHFCQAFGCDTEVIDPAQSGQRVNGITCLCWDVPCGGAEPLMVSGGHLAPRIGFGYQDAPSQLAAMLAMSRVPATYPARSGNVVRTVADLVEHEKLTCRSGTDMSLKLIVLANYVHEPAWTDSRGDSWSLERVVKEELARPVGTAPHAATSRLLGLSYTLETLVRRDDPIEGDFLRAKRYVEESIQYALRTQNTDGSWGRNTTRDYPSALSFTGHVFEWLAMTLPEDRLEDRQIVQSVQYCNRLLGSDHYQSDVQQLSGREIGAVMHAAHALVIYDQRVFAPADASPATARRAAVGRLLSGSDSEQ